MRGDGHYKTHSLLAELAAMMGSYINLRGGGHKKFAPMDFLPWRKKKTKVSEAKRIGGRNFLKKSQELKKRDGDR